MILTFPLLAIVRRTCIYTGTRCTAVDTAQGAAVEDCCRRTR